MRLLPSSDLLPPRRANCQATPAVVSRAVRLRLKVLTQQRKVVDAFLAALRGGVIGDPAELASLDLAVLDK